MDDNIRGTAAVLSVASLGAPFADHLRSLAERGVIGAPRWGRVLLSTAAFSGELERRSRALGFQIFMLVATLGLTQLLYVKLWIDAVSYWVSGGEPPYIFNMTFSWLSIVVFAVLLGSVWSAWEERARHDR